MQKRGCEPARVYLDRQLKQSATRGFSYSKLTFDDQMQILSGICIKIYSNKRTGATIYFE